MSSAGASSIEPGAWLDHFVRVRRRLHGIPELGYHEHLTAELIREELSAMKIDPQVGPDTAPTATLALIGDPRNPCIALRADIDALPIVERTGLPYASKHDGRMHACGHDGHTATLLAAASRLKLVEADLSVCVKLIFQPAEEGGGGGQRLVEAGVLDGRLGPKVGSIFGLHGWPGMPVGIVSTRPGPLLAATDTFEATFVGAGCHGAFPHWGTDPIVPAARAILSLQEIVTRELDPTESAVVTVAQINAGSASNVIPDRCTIRGTARTLTPAARDRVEQAIARRCQAEAEASGATAQVQYVRGYPPTVNDPASASRVAHVARETLGSGAFIPADRPSMGGEDFAYYLEQVPGCFFMVGLIPPGQTSHPSLHNDRFDFTDDAILTGVRMFVGLVRSN